MNNKDSNNLFIIGAGCGIASIILYILVMMISFPPVFTFLLAIEPDDAQMYLGVYRNANAEVAFDSFEQQRKNNVDYLRELPASAGDRRAIHREYGEITLSQMLNEWALHDLGHIRQIAELVRARKYLIGAGPMGREY